MNPTYDYVKFLPRNRIIASTIQYNKKEFFDTTLNQIKQKAIIIDILFLFQQLNLLSYLNENKF